MVKRRTCNHKTVWLPFLHCTGVGQFNEDMDNLFGPDVPAAAEAFVRRVGVVDVIRGCKRCDLGRHRSSKVESVILASTGGRQIKDHEQQKQEGRKSHRPEYNKPAYPAAERRIRA